jgi:hypothetical protein
VANDSEGALGCAVIIVAFFGAGVWALMGMGVVGEQEGVVKYSDCREVVRLQPDTFQKFYHSFTCETNKSQSGKVIDGICVRIVLASSWDSSSNACTSAYVYPKLPELKCTDPKFPKPGYDDMCHASY